MQLNRRDKKAKKRRLRRERTDAPRLWLLLASSPAALAAHADEIRDLSAAGHIVRLGYAGRRLPRSLRRGTHRLGTFRAGPARIATTLATGVLPRSQRLTFAARHDRWLAEVTPLADEVVFLDDASAEYLVDRVRSLGPHAQLWWPGEASRLLAEEAAWRSLTIGARELDAKLPGRKIAFSRVLDPARKLAELSREGPLREDLARDVRPELRRLSRWALRRGRFDRVEDLLAVTDLISTTFGPLPREDVAVLALRAHIALVNGFDRTENISELAAAVLAEADLALADDDLKEASELGAVAMGLLFHQQLHTAVAETPLVEDPETFLGPLHESKLGRLLFSGRGEPLGPQFALDQEGEDAVGIEQADGSTLVPTDEHLVSSPSPNQEQPPKHGPVRISVLPGVYGHHAGPLLQAIEADGRATLTTVRPQTASFRGMMIDAPILQYRLEHAMGRVPTVDLQVDLAEHDAVVDADVVVADWADKGAVWASTVVPADSRMVVRIHSVDVLSAPAQLVDWSRVDDIIFVADHIRDLFVKIMGERVAHAQMHVITNIVPPEKFSEPLLPSACRTLGVVGWAQVVKDPYFALEVLAQLLQEDASWRLRLIGSDFGTHHAAAATDYASRFRDRALQLDLVDHIDYTGFTRELPKQLRHVGFILNTSLREGCPIGTLEGIAAGAFPIVRDWPAFSSLNAARGLFPQQCVVANASEAADLIRSLAHKDERRQAVVDVRTEMAAQFSDFDTKKRLLEVIYGKSRKPTTVIDETGTVENE